MTRPFLTHPGTRMRFVLHRLPLVATFGAIASFLVHESYSFDVWWQLAIGRDLLRTRSIPLVDRYTAAAHGRPYHDSHWLFQTLLAWLEGFFGPYVPTLTFVGVWGVVFLLLYRACRREVGAFPAGVLVFFVAMASAERFLARPELVTFLMLALFYCRLKDGQFRRWNDLLLFGSAQVVWANSHGLFVMGPFLAGCYWVEALWRRSRSEPKTRLREMSLLMVVLFAASLATPFGFAGWEYAYRLFIEAGPQAPEVLRTLGELSPTFGTAARETPAFWFFAALLVATLCAAFAGVRSGNLSLPRTAIVAAMALTALTGRRNMVLFALVAAPFAAEHGASLISWARPRLPRFTAAIWVVIMAAWAAYPLSGRYYISTNVPARFGVGFTPSFFPHGLPPFLDAIDFRGQVYNSNTLGGFYLYHGYPNRLPLTDGRWEIYDMEVLKAIRNAPNSPPLLRAIVERYDIRAFLLQHASPEARDLVPVLARLPGWRLAYLDCAASFWVRADAALAAPTVDLSRAGEDVRLQPRRFEDAHMLDNFLRYAGAKTLRVDNLEAALAFGVRVDAILETLGKLQVELERYDDATRTFSRLLAANPKSVAALNELAFLAFRQGDRERAGDFLSRAVALDPDNALLRDNLERLASEGPRVPSAAPTGAVR